MIDPHCHLRDWKQKHKETVKHGLEVAFKAGLDAVFEMPNTDPPLTTEKTILKRLKLAGSAAVDIFHGLYAGVTIDPGQVKEVIDVYYRHFPRIVGLKLYAGPSTGGMDISGEDEQESVFRTLTDNNFHGVLAVHCEKKKLIRNDIYRPDNPFSHTLARPIDAEIESVKEIIRLARDFNFKGKLHICHVSAKQTVDLVNRAKEHLEISCGVTPHHLLLNNELMKNSNGFIYRVNPPLRPEEERCGLVDMLLNGKIDWIETDHAPHLLSEKSFASGLPGFPAIPILIKYLKNKGMDRNLLGKITHYNIENVFGFSIPQSGRMSFENLSGQYEYDPYSMAES